MDEFLAAVIVGEFLKKYRTKDGHEFPDRKDFEYHLVNAGPESVQADKIWT
jgi:hypothetical protein